MQQNDSLADGYRHQSFCFRAIETYARNSPAAGGGSRLSSRSSSGRIAARPRCSAVGEGV